MPPKNAKWMPPKTLVTFCTALIVFPAGTDDAAGGPIERHAVGREGDLVVARARGRRISPSRCRGGDC